jgi:hypothetical protein
MATEFEVTKFIDTGELKGHLEIMKADLSYSMMQQAGFFAYYGELAAKAQFQMDKFEQMAELIAARLDKRVRDAALADGRKITETQVKAEVSLQPKMIAVNRAVNEARMVASNCKTTAESFRHRRDMLIQMSFNDREERKGELRTYEERNVDAQEARRQRLENMHAAN